MKCNHFLFIFDFSHFKSKIESHLDLTYNLVNYHLLYWGSIEVGACFTLLQTKQLRKILTPHPKEKNTCPFNCMFQSSHWLLKFSMCCTIYGHFGPGLMTRVVSSRDQGELAPTLVTPPFWARPPSDHMLRPKKPRDPDLVWAWDICNIEK